MSGQGKNIVAISNRKRSSLFKSLVILFLVIFLSQHGKLLAQVLNNNGAAMSVSSGTVLNGKDVENTAGTVENGANIILTGSYTNAATTNGNGTYNIGGDWTNNTGLFTPGASTVIFDGLVNQTVTRTGGETFNNFTISNAGTPNTVTLGSALTVNGAATFITGELKSAFDINFNGSTVGGSGTINATAGTVTYAIGATNIIPGTYYNLTLTGASTKTLYGNVIVLNNLTISAGTLQLSDKNITVTGTSSIFGTIVDNNVSGSNLFIGLVTINAGGTWDFSAGNAACEFRGGLIHNGTTFNSGTGSYYFTTNNQDINGSTPITFDGNVSIASNTSLTNKNASSGIGVTLKGSLDGLNANSRYINEGITSYEFPLVVPMNTGVLDASVIGNIFMYSGGIQTISGDNNYFNLVITGSGSKTFNSNINVLGDLAVQNSTTISFGSSAAYTLDITGNLDASTGTIDMDNGVNINHVLILRGINNACNSFITDDQSIVEYVGGDNQQVFLSANYRNITLGGIGTKILQGNVMASGNTITLSANVNTNSFILFFNNGTGTVTRTSGAVIGKFQRIITIVGFDYLFPVGTATSYNPFKTIFTNLTSGSLLVNYNPADIGNSGLTPALNDNGVAVYDRFTEGYWTLKALNSLASTDYSVNLNYTGFTGVNAASRIVKRTDNGDLFSDGTHGTVLNPEITRTGLSGISTNATDLAIAHSRPYIITQPTDQTVCDGSVAEFSIAATGHGALSYRWQENAGSGFVNIINGGIYSGASSVKLTITGAALAMNTYKYRCIITDSEGNAKISNEALLSINPKPVGVSTPSSQTVCSDEAIAPIVLTTSNGMNAVTTYAWTRDNNINVTGLAASGIGDISGTPNNISNTYQIINYTIIPSSSFGCAGNPFTATIIVEPTPQVIPSVLTQNICENTYTNFTLNSQSTFTSGEIKFNYTALAPAGVTGFTPSASNLANGAVINDHLRNATNEPQIVTYVIIPLSPTGCSDGPSKTVYVTVNAQPIDTLLITQPLLCGGGAGSGALRVITSTGADPYQIYWTGPFSSDTTNVTDWTNLRNGGLYTVRVIDKLNCSKTVSKILPDAVTAIPYIYSPTKGVLPNIGVANVSCPGATDGEITIGVTGGVSPPYDYWVIRNNTETIDFGQFADISIFRTLPAIDAPGVIITPGLYTLRVRDVNGCFKESSWIVTEPDPIAVTFSKKIFEGGFNVSCSSYDDGSVWVNTITGGNGGPDIYTGGTTEPYTYKWTTSDGSFTGADNTYKINGVTSGTYSLTVTDLLGCSSIHTVVLTEPDGIELISSTLSESIDGNYNISCYGKNDGTISMDLTGGSGVYNFDWTGPAGAAHNNGSGRNQTGLIAGNYNVKVTDLNGCYKNYSFNLTQPDSLSINVVKSLTPDGAYNILCNGGTGSIGLTVTGGSPGNYTYNWTSGNGSGIIAGQEDQGNLSAGSYNITINDLNGCSVSRPITLSQPQPLALTLDPTNITCEAPGFDNGSINIQVSGGRSPYQFLWSNRGTTEDVSNLTAGIYTVTVTDAYGCFITGFDTVMLPPPLTISKTVSSFNGFGVSCYGMSEGRIAITPTNGDAPFTFMWTGPDGFTSTNPSISGLKAGMYIVRMTDRNYCTIIDTTIITQPEKLGMNVTLSSSNTGGFNINCAGDLTGTIELEPLNSVGAVRYLWSDGANGKSRYNLPADVYEVILTDKNNCQTDSTIILTQPDSIKVIMAIELPFCSDMPDGKIILQVTGGVITTDYSFRWSDNSTIRDRADVTKGSYWVSIMDDNGCEVIETAIVDTENESCLLIPNIFSPNGDFINDEWNIGMKYLYPEMEITIFNRWGEPVWKSEKGYPNPWDGRSNGKVLPVDSYHYILDLHNGSKVILGNVTIVN